MVRNELDFFIMPGKANSSAEICYPLSVISPLPGWLCAPVSSNSYTHLKA